MSLFLEHTKPLITTMLKPNNTADLVRDITAALKEGTDAFCLEIELMKTECRTATDFKDIFGAMDNKPCYITDYRRLNINDTEQSDEELTEEMLFAFSLAENVKLFDIRGDLFDPSPDEITYNDKAIEKQIALANEVHKMGGEVLMSSHPLRFLPYEDLLKIAKAQQERGVDIVKIVTLAESENELRENFEATLKLKKDLEKQFLFLCGGSHCRKHRLLAPLLSNSLFLSVQRGIDGGPQPQMDDAKKVMELSGIENGKWKMES